MTEMMKVKAEGEDVNTVLDHLRRVIIRRCQGRGIDETRKVFLGMALLHEALSSLTCDSVASTSDPTLCDRMSELYDTVAKDGRKRMLAHMQHIRAKAVERGLVSADN